MLFYLILLSYRFHILRHILLDTRSSLSSFFAYIPYEDELEAPSLYVAVLLFELYYKHKLIFCYPQPHNILQLFFLVLSSIFALLHVLMSHLTVDYQYVLYNDIWEKITCDNLFFSFYSDRHLSLSTFFH